MKNWKPRLLGLLTGLFACFIAMAGQRHSDTGKTLAWLALGDSYTIGEQVAVPARFPEQAIGMLAEKGLAVSAPEYVARTGWTSADLQVAIRQGTKHTSYDLVSLLIGVNDQYQEIDTAAYRQHFTWLLQRAIRFANDEASHVFVLSIPDYSVTPFGRNDQKTGEEIGVFNRINRQVAGAYKVVYVDITPFSKQAAQDRDLIAADGLHPSEKQYLGWASILVKSMLSVMK